MVLDNTLLKKIESFKQFIVDMIPIAGNQTPSADTTNGSSGINIDYAKSDHTHPKSALYAESSHTHDQYLTSQDILGKLDISQTNYKGKNVIVDNSTGNITFEDKPTIPQASISSPLADMTGGAIGSDSKYAKADHQHPLSSAYATSEHNHTINDLPSDIITNTEINDIIDTLNTNDIFTYSNKNAGQNGETICFVGKLYGDDIEGKTIQFYNNDTLLGSSNTDIYGTALYDYTCTGSGIMEITTKYGTLQSEIHEITDYIFYDKAVGSASTLSKWVNNDNLEIVGDDTGTLVTNSNSDNRNLYPKQSSAWIAKNSVIEFTYISRTGTVNVGCSGVPDRSISSFGFTNGDIFKIKILNDKIEYYKNNNQIIGTSFSAANTYFKFIINNGSIKFRDFKIYAI